MIANPTQSHDSLIFQVAEKYKHDGYNVVVEPESSDLPFDLGMYRPDLLVTKTKDEGYIVEIKSSPHYTSVDRYREVSELVSEHEGWRFLLVTGEDAPTNEQNGETTLSSWDELHQREERSNRLVESGDTDTAFLVLWTVLEALMRKRAEQVSIPIERFPTQSLIKHLYSQGELSIEHYDEIMSLLNTRNRLAHGFQAQESATDIVKLQNLVTELFTLWEPQKKDGSVI